MRLVNIAGLGCLLAEAKWSGTEIDASDKPLVVLYYDEWAKWQQGFSVYQMDKVILSRKMPVRNWVINYSFLTWSVDECRLVPTDCGAGWSSPDTEMFPGSRSWWEPSPWAGAPAANVPGFVALKQKYPYIKLLWSVGGWSACHSFGDCIRSKPDNMIESALDYVYYFDFDGIDLDWEYPNCPNNDCGCQNEPTCPTTGNKGKDDDWEVYKQWLLKLRAGLDKLEDKMNRKLYITAAIGMNPKHIKGEAPWSKPLPIEWICDTDAFDWVNLMTYDFYGPWAAKTGHLAPLYKSTGANADAVQFSTDESMQLILSRCSKPYKLTMGLAAYGKGWANVPKGNGIVPGLWQESQNKHTEIIKTNFTYGPWATYEYGTYTFWDLQRNYLPHSGCKRTWDAETKNPTLYCETIPKKQPYSDLGYNVFITYEDAEAWKEKMAYARSKGMAGAIIWAASNTGHFDHKDYVGTRYPTTDAAAELYTGLFEGWYGSPQPIGGSFANGAYTYKGAAKVESTCPYAYTTSSIGGWKTSTVIPNNCYTDPSASTKYQSSKYEGVGLKGSGTPDTVGQSVKLIGPSGSVPVPEPTVAPEPTTTEVITTAEVITGDVPNTCTLPPSCSDYMVVPRPTSAPIESTTTAPIITTTTTPASSSDPCSGFNAPCSTICANLMKGPCLNKPMPDCMKGIAAFCF